jgi:ribosome-binding protein aMBF1 (putative translation factor)
MKDPFKKYEQKYRIDKIDHNTVEYFSGAIRIALQEYGVTRLQIADKFKVSESSVERWLKRTNLPLKEIRGIVLGRLVDLISQRD